MKRPIVLLTVLVTVIVLLIACEKRIPEQYTTVETDEIIYKEVDGQSLGLDICYPTNRLYEKNPTVIVLHGGGWVSGSREDFTRDFAPLCSLLRENGITVVSVSYRLATAGSWKTCLSDCEDALYFLLDRAVDYDIDTDNIGIIGYSAGAHLAMMTAIETENLIKTCVSLSGPVYFSYSPTSIYYSDTLTYYLSRIYATSDNTEMLRASPLIRVNHDCKSSFLLVCGDSDDVVPTVHAESFYKEATSFGITSDLWIINGLTHIYPLYPEFQTLCENIASYIINNKVF